MSKWKKAKRPKDQPPANPEQQSGEKHAGNDTHVRGEIEISRSPSLTQEHNAERNEDNASEKKEYVIGVITLFSVFVVAGLTLWQGCLTRNAVKLSGEANEISRQGLISVQRAFVLPGSIETMPIGPQDAPSLMLYAKWENSGATPAKGTSHVSYRWDVNPMPDNFAFPDNWDEGAKHIATPFIIGPKGDTGLMVGPLSSGIVRGIVLRKFHLHLWGWAKYRDIFKDTPEHVTEFCSELIPIDIQSSKRSATSVTTEVKFRVDNCPRHNCFDEDCQTEK